MITYIDIEFWSFCIFKKLIKVLNIEEKMIWSFCVFKNFFVASYKFFNNFLKLVVSRGYRKNNNDKGIKNYYITE